MPKKQIFPMISDEIFTDRQLFWQMRSIRGEFSQLS